MRSMGIYQREGRWYVRWRRGGRLVRKSLGPGIKTKTQAEAVWRQLERKRLEGKLALLDPSQTPLGDFAHQYLEERQGQLAESSIDRYRVAFKVLADDLGEKTMLRSLTGRKIAQWANTRLARGISPAGVNADLRHIKAALRKAAKWGLIEKAPEIEMLKTPKRLPRHIPPEQLEEILNAEQHSNRKRLWIFLLWTGCRRSEALNLSWEHISWGEKPAARIVGKGDKERIVPLLLPVVKALGKRIDLGPVFPGFHPITTSKWWRKLVKKGGISGGEAARPAAYLFHLSGEQRG